MPDIPDGYRIQIRQAADRRWIWVIQDPGTSAPEWAVGRYATAEEAWRAAVAVILDSHAADDEGPDDA